MTRKNEDNRYIYIFTYTSLRVDGKQEFPFGEHSLHISRPNDLSRTCIPFAEKR